MRILSVLFFIIFSSVVYAATPSSVYVTDSNGAPILTTTLPSQLTIPSPLLQGYYVNVLSQVGVNNNTVGTGTADQSTYINTALGMTVPGSGSKPANVYLPAGTYHVTNTINLGNNQCLFGDGWQTIIDVDMDFNPSATGVIVVAPGNNAYTEPCIKNLQINFHLPPDITATASAASGGASSITVSGATGTITNGMYVLDITTTNAIPFTGASNFQATTVNSVSGGTIGITPVTNAAVNSSDVIHFASTRSAMTALGTCSTTTPGGSACQYPWAIYCASCNQDNIDGVLIQGAYNGVYNQGGAYHIGFLAVGAINTGISLGNSFNFSSIDSYSFWAYGFSPGNNPTSAAFASNFYDGNTIAASLNETDGFIASKFAVWTGKVNITTSFSWGHFNSLSIDGNYANLNISTCQWLQIGQMYTTKGTISTNPAIAMSASGCRVTIDSIKATYANGSYSWMTISAGTLSVATGVITDNETTNSPTTFINQTGGVLYIGNTVIENGSLGTGVTWLTQTSGSVGLVNNKFISSPNSSTAFSLTDVANNLVLGNTYNGWTWSAPGHSGRYENNSYGSNPSNSGTCAITSQAGGLLAGTFHASGACAGGTVIFSMTGYTPTPPAGWACNMKDLTTPADLMNQTVTSPASVTFTGTMANNDVVTFSCLPY